MKTTYYNSRKRFAVATGIFFTLLLGIAPENNYAQQQAGIAGIDHIGINVPDMQKAIVFFSDVLGFTPVTQIGPITLDATWKQTNHMQPGTGAVTIKMVRAGTGANIELFQYSNNKGSQHQPGSDDIGSSHIAFYTTDIQAAVTYLKSRGITVLGTPFLTPTGDTEGESWVYFETPWGAKMELVSYPNGKGYEKKHPQTILWSPANNTPSTIHPATNTTMSTKDIPSLVALHLQLWNEHDETKRNSIATQTYAPDVEMVDRHFTAKGVEKINNFIKELQQKNPDSRFTHVQPIDTHTNVARLFWQFGTTAKPNIVTGMDLFVIENGRISKLYVFVDESH